MQEYYSTSFLIKLNNDKKMLQEINHVYIHIQKANRQNIFTSIKKRENTFISFYNEEGIIFSEEDILGNSLKVNIHEYQMEDIDQNEAKNSSEQKSDIWEKDSLFGFASITLNQISSKIYSALNPDIIIGEFIYTLKPHYLNKSPSYATCSWTTPIDIKSLDKSNTLAVDNSQNPTSSNKPVSLSSSSLTDSNSCKGADPYNVTDNTQTKNKQYLEVSQNQKANARENFNFLKLLNQQNQQQSYQQYNFQNEEDSTETPTSKLISSQGDLSSSRQQTPIQSMNKSANLINSKEEKHDLSPNRFQASQKQNQYQEILTPISNRNTSYSNHNSPINISQNISCGTAVKQQEQKNAQNNQQLQTFTQYLAYQQNQKNNPIQTINKFNNQLFNQYQQSPVYNSPQQIYGNNHIQQYQICTSQYQNQLQNRIQSLPIHPQNNVVFQNNQPIIANQNFSSPQHRIIQQQSPYSQHLQNAQIPYKRNSSFAPVHINSQSPAPFIINQRF